jgi:hypothetical protein
MKLYYNIIVQEQCKFFIIFYNIELIVLYCIRNHQINEEIKIKMI